MPGAWRRKLSRRQRFPGALTLGGEIDENEIDQIRRDVALIMDMGYCAVSIDGRERKIVGALVRIVYHEKEI